MTKVINTPNPVPSSDTAEDSPCEEALKTLFSSDEVEGNNGTPEDSEEIVVIDGAKNLVSEETGSLPAQSPITALAKLSDTPFVY